MLYDKKWDAKPDLEFAGVSLRAFIAWLETKPADDAYDYVDDRGCALAQYLQSTGVPKKNSYVDMGFTPPGELWIKSIVITLPQTFGAALERARKFAAAR